MIQFMLVIWTVLQPKLSQSSAQMSFKIGESGAKSDGGGGEGAAIVTVAISG